MSVNRAHWEKETDTHIFFWGGIFSNWAITPFNAKLAVLGNMRHFNCGEQYMMAQKAGLFSDVASFNEIMFEESPREQKALGRKVKGYSDAVWDPVARSLVYPGLYAKFTQNKDLGDLLLGTGDKGIVEASPFDKKWGIGLATTDIAVEDPKNWQGLNWLGQVIMKVRTDMRDGVSSSFTDIDWSLTNALV